MGWFDVGQLLSLIIVIALIVTSFRKKTLSFIKDEFVGTAFGELAEMVLEIKDGKGVERRALAIFAYMMLYLLFCLILYFVIMLLSYIILFILLIYLIAIVVEKIIKKK